MTMDEKREEEDNNAFRRRNNVKSSRVAELEQHYFWSEPPPSIWRYRYAKPLLFFYKFVICRSHQRLGPPETGSRPKIRAHGADVAKN